jgi:hypothetical protein
MVWGERVPNPSSSSMPYIPLPVYPLAIIHTAFDKDFSTDLLRMRVQILAIMCLSLSPRVNSRTIFRRRRYKKPSEDKPPLLTWKDVNFIIRKNPTGGRNFLFCLIKTQNGEKLLMVTDKIPAADGPMMMLILAMMDGAIVNLERVEQVLNPGWFKNYPDEILGFKIKQSR